MNEKNDIKLKHYVYVHRRETDGAILYVGKGVRNRYKTKANRNIYWHNIVNKHGFESEIVRFFNNDKCALTFEKILINKIGRSKLCNLTDGGDGHCGYKPSLETRKKQVAARKGLLVGARNAMFDVKGKDHHSYKHQKYVFTHPELGEFIGTQADLIGIHGVFRGRASGLISGRQKHANGWTIKGSGVIVYKRKEKYFIDNSLRACK